MDRFDRIFELHKILSHRRTPISRRELQEKLECSRATVKRLIDGSRLFLNAPIRYDRARNGYHYDLKLGQMYELPGLWLNSSELFALVVSEKLLADVQPGLLAPALAPLRNRIAEILRHRRLGHPEMERRIRILQIAS
ncbi:MAG: helix-turn-helix transcriptional regulator, partial [Gammaproteobacteria bacterium]